MSFIILLVKILIVVQYAFGDEMQQKTTQDLTQVKILESMQTELSFLRESNKFILKKIAACNEMMTSFLTNMTELSSCAEATARSRISGTYYIKTRNGSLKVVCDADYFGGGWLVIHRRRDGALNFTRSWDEYKAGFGDLNNEFFIGLDSLHELTTWQSYELLIITENLSNKKTYARYENFEIADEKQSYKLKVGSFHGNSFDPMSDNNQMMFSTPDRDNDNCREHCAAKWSTGWWFNKCHHDQQQTCPGHQPNCVFIFNWMNIQGNQTPIKLFEMMIRPTRI